MKPWLIKETNWKSVKETFYDIVIIPWGATEAHNYHLPYATDNYLADYVSDKAAEMAWHKGVKTAVLPVIPFGVNTGQLDLSFTINVNPSTQFLLLRDILETLYTQGLRKYIILNAHGGNDFKQMIRELQPKFPDCFLCQLNWYTAVPFREIFEDTGEHAGEAETSAMMVVAPSLIRPLEEAGNGKHKNLRFKAREEGWMWAPRPWSRVSEDTGIGNPAKASLEKGKKYLDESIKKLSDFLIELSRTTSADDYYI